MRYFNTEGLCRPDEHYMVRLDDRLACIKNTLVDRKKYFVIYRGRQYRKTTTLKALAKYLSGDYVVFSLDFQQMSTAAFANINNQEETDSIIKRHSDGLFWVHSGDLGYVSEDGFVYISGRLKRYIIYATTGIYKIVFSLDIERVILNAPRIAKCAVVPIKDEAAFQVPVAYIIWKKGYVSKEDLETVREYAEEHL